MVRTVMTSTETATCVTEMSIHVFPTNSNYIQEGSRAETMVKSQYAFTVLLKFHSRDAKCFHYEDTTYSVMVAHAHTHTYTYK